MFKLISLRLFGCNGEDPYVYSFSDGINYFKGRNDSGKTEFYTFLDYMFGSSEYMYNKAWFRDSLDSAELRFAINGREFVIIRSIKSKDDNKFYYADETDSESIRAEELKEKLNSVFAASQESLKDLRQFVEEDISYRTFTVFNFFGEGRQGTLNDFFDKCSDLRYSIKMPALLNYIFNKNVARIEELKKEEQILRAQLESSEKCAIQNDSIRARVNDQLKVLDLDIAFTGKNADEVLAKVNKLQLSLEKAKGRKETIAITELEAIYTSLDEQIKKQAQFEKDHKRFIADDENQKQLIDALQRVVSEREEYHYLIDPILSLSNELTKSISFNKYLIQDNSIKELEKQREDVRKQILDRKSKYIIYSVEDKSRAITLISEYLDYYNCDFDYSKINELKTKLKKLRAEIKALQNANDQDKINELSKVITNLYRTSANVSELSEYDFRNEGFQIRYIKNGNTIQPQIIDKEAAAGDQVRNYYTGSMARHTLMQLCGYIGFLQMLIKENRYPIIPFLVIDHISKPFDEKNVKAIGTVLNEAYRGIEKTDFQMIIFDDEDAERLGIKPDNYSNLFEKGKSGFNPFYYALAEDEREKPQI